MEDRIIKLLKKINPMIDYRNETGFFSNKLLDSLGFVTLVSEIEEEFSISIGFDCMDPANFDSIELIKKQIVENTGGE